jgi:hypothetical protein
MGSGRSRDAPVDGAAAVRTATVLLSLAMLSLAMLSLAMLPLAIRLRLVTDSLNARRRMPAGPGSEKINRWISRRRDGRDATSSACGATNGTNEPVPQSCLLRN